MKTLLALYGVLHRDSSRKVPIFVYQRRPMYLYEKASGLC